MTNSLLLSFTSFVFLFILACSPASESAPPTDLIDVTAENLELTDYEGTNAQKLQKKDNNNKIEEEGTIIDGRRHGSWFTFHPRNNMIKSITNYVQGKLNGKHLEYNDRGQITLESNYVNEQLHGPLKKYRFGKILELANYVNGQIDGNYKLYHKNGKLQQESNFVMGKREGPAKYYNEAGELIMEYEYKDNEIVSGGKVDPQPKADNSQ